MSARTLPLDDALYAYLLEVSLREPAFLAELRAKTQAMPQASMQLSPEQGQFMALLVRLLGATRCLEIGTFTGYSSTVIAMALPSDALLVALDRNEDWTAVAKETWARAGVAHKIDLRLGEARDSLAAMVTAEQGQYDFIFIDADKINYTYYYDAAMELLRPGGLIAIDNTLWGGRVTDLDDDSEDTCAIRSFNQKLHADERIDLSVVPIGDGLTLARKRR